MMRRAELLAVMLYLEGQGRPVRKEAGELSGAKNESETLTKVRDALISN